MKRAWRRNQSSDLFSFEYLIRRINNGTLICWQIPDLSMVNIDINIFDPTEKALGLRIFTCIVFQLSLSSLIPLFYFISSAVL